MEAVVGRLERLADRLEKFEVSLSSGGSSGVPLSRLSSGGSVSSVATAAPADDPVSAYDAFLAEFLTPVADAGSRIGGEVAAITSCLEKAFKAVRTVLAIAANAKQPSQQEMQALVQPVAEQIMAAQKICDDRKTRALQHAKVVAESLQSMSWLLYTGPSCGMPAPAQFVLDCWNTAEFFANKLLMEYRNKDETQVLWIRGAKEVMQRYSKFIKSNYPTGLKWNAAGGSVKDAAKAVPAAAPARAAAGTAAGAPAPVVQAPRGPPPPPAREVLFPPDKQPAAGGAAGGPGAGMANVLSALSKGGGVTSGLRKVTDDMKTKNRTDRSGLVATEPKPAAASAAPKAAVAAPKAPPRVELEQGRKWVVENLVGKRDVVIDQTDVKQAVYIYNCTDCVIQVKGKINMLSIDKCKKTGVVFEELISSCEVVNATSVQVQATGHVATMAVEKTDGCQIYLPEKTAMNPAFQLVTAKCSEINVIVVAGPEEDPVEHAVPEQFISTFKGGKLITEASVHAGA